MEAIFKCVKTLHFEDGKILRLNDRVKVDYLSDGVPRSSTGVVSDFDDANVSIYNASANVTYILSIHSITSVHFILD